MRGQSEETSRLAEKNLEMLDENLDKLRELMQRWDQRLTLVNMRLAERFDAIELRILLPFWNKQSGKRWILSLEPVIAAESFTGAQDAIDAHRDQSPVFVNVIHFVEFPERVIPTLIRLKSVDELDSTWFNDSLYFSTSQGFVVLERFANRERDLSQHSFVGTRIKNQSQLIHQVVEGAPEVLQHVASNSKHIEVNDLEISELKLSLSELRVLLGNSNISIGIPVGLSSCFEFGEVLFGPFNLYADRDCPDPVLCTSAYESRLVC